MIELPKNAVDILRDKTAAAHSIVENITAAYWLHGRDNGAAQFLWNNVHTDFARLADALGYTIARKADEVAA